MIQYIYFVKCPGCEDEHFDFFDEAKEFALSCLSQKPIITQTEIDRNDFGECTDHCDLGTVWSWEDMMQETTTEPAISVFTKDDLKGMASGKDPEFDSIDNSVDFEIEEISDRKPISENAIQAGGFRTDGYRTALACYDSDDFDINVEFGMQDEEEYEVEDQLYLLRPGQTVADLVVYLSRKCGFTNVYVYGETSATRGEIKTATRFETEPGTHDYRHYGTIADRLVEKRSKKDRKPILEELDINFEVPGFAYSIKDQFEDEDIKGYNLVYSRNGIDIVEVEVWEEDSPVTVNANLYAPNIMDSYYDSFDSFAADLVYKADKYLKESKRTPVPEGMTIKELVEEMEENEDEVECALCQELFAKSDCYYDEDEGYICPECKENTVKCTWCGMHFDPSECRMEVDLGWLCSRCEAAIKSRGETLTFKEGNYWDFLDEAVQTKTWVCTFEGKEIGTVEATTEEDAAEKMQRKYPDYNYSLYDGCFDVFPADKEDLTEASLTDILADANREFGTSYNERDLLDLAGVEDEGFFDDLETPEEVGKELYHKRGTNAFGKRNTDSKLEELEEAADYRKRLALCPECGAENAFDHETGFCLKCGFNI